MNAETLERLGVERAEAVAAEKRATAKLRDAVRAAHQTGGYTDVELAALARVDRMTVLSWTGRRGTSRRKSSTRGPTVSTTTGYGTWNNHGDRSHVRVEDTVAVYLGEFVDDYDLDALVAAYRAAINEALPEGVSLHGDEFYGPHPRDFDADLSSAIESVDLGALAEQHDLSAKENQS